MWITNLHEASVTASKSSKILTRSSTGKFASIVSLGRDSWILESVWKGRTGRVTDRDSRVGYSFSPEYSHSE